MLGAKTAAQLTKEIGYPTSNVKALNCFQRKLLKIQQFIQRKKYCKIVIGKMT